MKKFLSTILAVVMVLSSMAMVVSANGTETLADGIYVNGVLQSSFSAAQTAAGADGTITISGTVYFDTRQGISVDGLKLVGVNNARIEPSTSFGAEGVTETNKKALLNVAANDVEISNITFDGSRFGDTLDMSALNILTGFTDFIVVRVNSGSVEFDNVTIEGSKKTLLSVGTSTSSATVTATELYCNADSVKNLVSLADGTFETVFADVSVIQGTFDMDGGMINGFIVDDDEFLSTNDIDVSAEGLFTFTKEENYELCANPEWLATAYINSNLSYSQKEKYVNYVCGDNLTKSTKNMVEYLCENIDTMSSTAVKVKTVFQDLLDETAWLVGDLIQDETVRATLQNYIDDIDEALTPAA